MNTRRWWSWRAAAPVVAALLAGSVLAACGGGGPAGSAGAAPGRAGVTITLYSGQHPQTTAALVAAFEKQTGVQVRERDGDEDVLAQQIVQEGANSPADVYYSENSPDLQFLAGKGDLAELGPAVLGKVPARYSSPQGKWVGVTARVSGIVYNTRLVRPSQLPRSVMDLAGPVWAGRLGLAPSETDFQPVITSVEHTYGHARALSWLKGLDRNAGNHVYPDNETLVAEVNSGQVAIGIVDHYYWYRLAYELGGPAHMHSRFTTFAPRDAGYVLDVSGAGVLRTSRHQAAARRFVAFLVSKQGQEIIARSQSYEYPVASGVKTSQPIPAFSSLDPAPLTISELGSGSGAIALLHEAQLL